jgi:hypothetical protein
VIGTATTARIIWKRLDGSGFISIGSPKVDGQ